jgi:hypothetical protein
MRQVRLERQVRLKTESRLPVELEEHDPLEV